MQHGFFHKFIFFENQNKISKKMGSKNLIVLLFTVFVCMTLFVHTHAFVSRCIAECEDENDPVCGGDGAWYVYF